jgi:hypothetical protein
MTRPHLSAFEAAILFGAILGLLAAVLALPGVQ